MSTDVLSAGEMLSWYRIVGVLGRGGFGVTYEALDTNLNMAVAIKEYLPGNVITRDPDNSVRPITHEDTRVFTWGLERFIDEARTLATFKHPSIIRVLSVFEQHGTAYMIMEYEHGDDLKTKLSNCPEIREESSLRHIIQPVLSGLSEVHLQGFIHRDIKPSNLYVRNNGTPVLLDFGSARQVSDQSMQTLTSMVSTGFAPLEQYSDSESGQQGPWTDIYALGAVLHFAITEQAPIDSLIRAAAVVNGRDDPYIPLRNCAELQESERYTEHFLDAIDWALSFKADDRPQSLLKWKQLLLDDDSTLVRHSQFLHTPSNNLAAETPRNTSKSTTEQSAGAVFRVAVGSNKWHTRLLLLSTVTLLVSVLYLLQRDSEPAEATSLTLASSVNQGGTAIIDPKNAIVEVPWIAASESPVIDGMYDAIWNKATYNDTTPNLLAINKLILGSDPTRSDRQTEYKWGALHDGTYLYIMVFYENAAGPDCLPIRKHHGTMITWTSFWTPTTANQGCTMESTITISIFHCCALTPTHRATPTSNPDSVWYWASIPHPSMMPLPLPIADATLVSIPGS